MDPPNPSLLQLQDDRLSSVRKRNKILIAGFFSLIILLALIIGGIIISLVQKINSNSMKIEYSNRPVQEFCSPFVTRSSCITFLSYQIKAPPNTNPNRIFKLSLEASLRKISTIISRSKQEVSNCSSSLSHATSQLNNILEVTRIDPNLETYERGNMTAWITAAVDDVGACMSDLMIDESTAAVDGVRTTVDEVADLLVYSRDFLVNCEVVNENFRWGPRNNRSLRDEIVENLMTVSLFGSQYFVLVFLFCLLLRIYCC